ncbi:43989_t:CDS:2 [Gigaspora margarita]|uniref:43989_t:CDS:1 n=1 Tax=Gigaspora margarita TaxID=4874 RepID=A0ABM8W0R9_GIGMA|nr:43989_t:CDS:2 [Gigaspora margarita]
MELSDTNSINERIKAAFSCTQYDLFIPLHTIQLHCIIINKE